MNTSTPQFRESLQAQISEMPATDLYELLNDRTQQKLMEQFIAAQDACDLMDAWQAVIRAFHGRNVDKAGEYCQRTWEGFLDDCSLPMNYGDQLLDALAAQHGD